MIALAAFLLTTQADEAALRARVTEQPRPVRQFIERRAMCNHWLGEEPYDSARRREIARAVRALRCNRIEEDGAALRRRFTGRAATLAILDETRDLYD